MTTLFQDPTLTQPDASSVLQAPGQSAPGIGLGSPQSGLGIASPNVAQDAMQARVNAMPADQRIFSGLGEVGAALKGDPSPMATQDQQQQTLKMNNFKLLNETMGALQQGLTLIQGTSGEDRKRLATAYASKLDSTEPGMGQVFSALSNKPGMLDMLKQNAHLLPQSWQMEIVNDPQSALKRLGTPEGQATFNAAMEVPLIDKATERGMYMLGHWQQLVSPELAKEIGNPTNLSTGDLVKINNAVKENPQYAKLAIPDDALRVALTHDAFASSLHLMDSKGTQAVLQKQSEVGMGQQSNIATANADLKAGRITRQQHDDLVKKETHVPPVANVNVTMGTDAVDQAAARYRIDGTLPTGLGRGGANQGAILNRAAEQAKAEGQTGESARISQIANKANTTALAQLSKQEAQVGSFEKTANSNADLALAASDKVDRTGVPVLNRWIQAGRQNITGDVEASQFNAYNNVFSNEYAKVISGTMGNSPVSDAARAHALDVINTAQTKEQYSGVISALRADMKNRMAGFADQRNQLTGSIRNPLGNTPATNGAQPAHPDNIQSLLDKYK